MVHHPQQWVLKSMFDQETCIFFKGVSIHPYTPWDRNICPHSPPECRRSQTGMFGPTCRRRSARHARSKLNDPNVRRTTRRSLYPQWGPHRFTIHLSTGTVFKARRPSSSGSFTGRSRSRRGTGRSGRNTGSWSRRVGVVVMALSWTVTGNNDNINNDNSNQQPQQQQQQPQPEQHQRQHQRVSQSRSGANNLPKCRQTRH